MRNGKQKGSAFERVVCKRLSLWVSAGKRDDLFWRSAMSGGRATMGRKAGADRAHHAGDITSTSAEGHELTDRWYVECKFYKDLSITGALFRGEGLLARFWRETVEAATAHHKMPMLIAKQNNMPALLIIPSANLLSPTGIGMFYSAKFGGLSLLRCDVYSFEAVTDLPFKATASGVDHQFLRPGELARIMGWNTDHTTIGKTPIKRVRMKR